MKPVYVDMDDVLCETTRSYGAVVAEEFGKTVPYGAIQSFDLKTSFSLTESEYRHLFAKVHTDDFLSTLPPVPDAVETLRQWAAEKWPIHVVTGRLTCAHDASLAWLLAHNIPFDRFLMVDKYGRKEMDPNRSVPLSHLKPKMYRFAVEDAPGTIPFLVKTLQIPVFLFDRPWNKTLPESPCLHRVRSWSAIRNHSFFSSNR